MLLMTFFAFLFLFTFFITFVIIFPLIIPRLTRARIVGKDIHKPQRIELPEMGGLGIISGFCLGTILAIGVKIFIDNAIPLDVTSLLAVLSSILMISLIGIFDDLFAIRQWVKTLLPALAALPLMATKTGYTVLFIPFGGPVEFGIFYSLLLIPLGVTGAANGVNMLAGFNGLELGMGSVAIITLAIIAYHLQAMTAFAILIIAMGALLAALYFNRYPAKVLIGDVGTLSIGAIIASAVIIGNFEMAGIIIIIPYFADFLLKAAHRFPSKGWGGIYKNGRLFCPDYGPVGLCQLIMKIAGGITEKRLVLTLIGIEALFGIAAIFFYVM